MLAVMTARGEVQMTITQPVEPAASTDQALVGRCQRGDPGALRELIERHQAAVFGACLRLVQDQEAALELANGVFFKAYRHLDQYDPSRPLRPWLLRIATNEALNYLRGRQQERQQLVAGPTGASLAEQQPAASTPEAEVLSAERQQTVRAAVATLPEHYRLLITLRFFAELSYAEIAEQTGVSINTVGVQLARARAQLRQTLAGQEVTDADSSQ